MRNLFLCIAFLFIQITTANTVVNNEIVLPKEFIPKSTYSGTISKDKSFHLIFTKNKTDNKFHTFAYIYNGTNVSELPSYLSLKESSIISYHGNSKYLTLVVNVVLSDKSFYKLINYNLETKKSTESILFANDHFLVSMQQKEKSILVYKYDTKLKVVTINGTNKPVEQTIPLNTNLKLFFQNQSISSVKNDEYVRYGSTKTIRAYINNNTLYFTRNSKEPIDFKKKAIIPLIKFRYNVVQNLRLNLSDKVLKPEFSTLFNSNKITLKKSTSYLHKDKLVHLEFSKKQGVVNLFDLNTNRMLVSVALENLFDDFITNNTDFVGIPNFLKLANKGDYIPTITVNQTTDNKLRVRLDYVKTNYSYNYDWMLYHQEFYTFHNKQIFLNKDTQNRINESFDLVKPDDIAFEESSVISNLYSFELLFDDKGKLLRKKFPETIYKNQNKFNLLIDLEKKHDFNFVSSTFVNNDFRALVYIKSLNKFFFKINNI
jgi:hypothetical protein